MNSQSTLIHENSATSWFELVRADGLWFADGGLIIQAETTVFRVYRDFLAIHSAVFRDMLSIPIPVDAETMEGCPLVRLTDSAADVACFLKALLYPQFFESFPAPSTFQIVAAVLRMSHKYDVDVLRKRALVHLSRRFHTTLNGRDDESLDPDFGGRSLLAVITLARQIDALWILPYAFYCVCANPCADEYIINDAVLHCYSSMLRLQMVENL
ncbi:hypothetical protein K438DRAFT_2000673 [Mycena galopus ATCC 62051]|nr:hypothetical protein K438DRAFT_2000673 [Mycena galopus ATCC 62051]